MDLDGETAASAPFAEFFVAHLNQSDERLWQRARVGVAVAFGNHPERLELDPGLVDFVDDWIKDSLFPWVIKAASLQLPLLSFSGQLETAAVSDSFLAEAAKVKDVLLPVKEAADAVFSDPARSWHLFSAVVAAAAIICRRNRRLAKLYGARKSLLGKWKTRTRAHRAEPEPPKLTSGRTAPPVPDGSVTSKLEGRMEEILGEYEGHLEVARQTTYWALRWYCSNQAHHPDWSPLRIMERMVSARYQLHPAPEQEAAILADIAASPFVHTMVISILKHEDSWPNHPVADLKVFSDTLRALLEEGPGYGIYEDVVRARESAT